MNTRYLLKVNDVPEDEYTSYSQARAAADTYATKHPGTTVSLWNTDWFGQPLRKVYSARHNHEALVAA